ncbi:hypothetical protein PANO66_04222 [Planktothrix agardhii]|uniref:Uncharacterized protein n=1 Tax=Planktothrix agardhii TaxID=1160 RepID=A0AAD1V815_PLAAG|nr:hypothetical protein NIES204_03810 [Planktothrix agardhii NIES-204]CAD5974575.1 hypothetical protein PANO66_04222 [Planktothrix agardhii]
MIKFPNPFHPFLLTGCFGMGIIFLSLSSVQAQDSNVTVKTAAGVAGDNAINIQNTGAIYIY